MSGDQTFLFAGAGGVNHFLLRGLSRRLSWYFSRCVQCPPRPGTDLLLLGQCHPDPGRDLGGDRSGPGMSATENEVLITGMFLGAGLLACVVIPGLLVMGDRVHDHLGTGEVRTSPGFFYAG